MRLVRQGWLALMVLLLPTLVGCMGEGTSRAKLFDRLPFMNSELPADSAFLEYVLIDRPAGREDINRDVWERVDEQIVNADVRSGLEVNGLRMGTISDTMPGVLRGMVDDPRTSRGHRFRSFAADKSAILYTTPEMSKVAFTMSNGDREAIKFARDQAVLGFEISVKELPDSKLTVKLTPVVKYYDQTMLVPKANGSREEALETFSQNTIELTVSNTEYIVIGTDYFANGTFGHGAFVGDSPTSERAAQRVLVLRAGLSKAARTSPKLLNGKDDPTGAMPIASQASLARGQNP